MSTSLRVSEETKAILERLKGDEETFDELLARLAKSEQPIEIGAWSEEEAENVRATIEESRESFER